MMVFLSVFVLFLAVILLLAGLMIVGGRPLKGSCGGVGGDVCACEKEGRPQGSCDEDGPEQKLIEISTSVPPR